MGDFVWANCLARLAFPQLHRPLFQGCLSLSCPVKNGPSPCLSSGSSTSCLREAGLSSTFSTGWGQPSRAGCRAPHWPSSTTISGSPGSPVGGCGLPHCCLEAMHLVLQALKGLDVLPAPPSHLAEASPPSLEPNLEEAPWRPLSCLV
jgi:hypothetical protein